jgi:hypothetical protein
MAAETPDSSTAILSPPLPLSNPSFTPTSDLIEKEFIHLYFQNLHVIYCILDRDVFFSRSGAEIWSKSTAAISNSDFRRPSKFPALYCAVVALGALVSGEDVVEQTSSHSRWYWDALRKQSGKSQSHSLKQSHLPRELAEVYFSRAKALLGDIFESCSLETQQTLFLLSIFCHYALKPHTSYMYHGMAARTAMSIGSPNLLNLKKNPAEAIRTWWCMYYHEVEVCSLLGRESILKDPESYPVFVAKWGDPVPKYISSDELSDKVFFARSNTELARILRQVSETIYQLGSDVVDRSHVDRYQAALDLDAKLLHWREDLKPVYDLEDASLVEKETVTKRKIILQLRKSALRLRPRPHLLINYCRFPQREDHDSQAISSCGSCS